MKQNYACHVLLGIVGAAIGCLYPTSGSGTELFVEEAAVHYGTKRPFSFYYPYNYKYYTPHRTSYAKRLSTSPVCYWRYMYGSYVYYCK